MLDACPKCGTARERAEPRGACPTCGLRLSLWPSFDDRPTPDPVLDPVFTALDWPAASSHDAFIALAQNAGLLDGAAARYRHALRSAAKEGDARTQAERALAQIALLAVHAGKSSRPLHAGTLKFLRAASLVLAIVLCALVGVVLWRTFGKGFSLR